MTTLAGVELLGVQKRHWLDRKRDAVLKSWRANTSTYAEAMRSLHQLGWSVEYTAKVLAR